jgi:hypothetical protein
MTGTAIDLIDTALLRQYPEEATTADVALLLEEVQRLSHLVDVDVADDALLQRIAAMAVDLETATTELNRKERELETWRGRAIDAELEAARIHHMMGGSDLASGDRPIHRRSPRWPTWPGCGPPSTTFPTLSAAVCSFCEAPT